MSMCLVCNGMTSIQSTCPQCNALLSDEGRVSDFYGQYSPYREIDSEAMNNGIADVEQHRCLHLTYCSSCDYQATISIQELIYV